MHSRRAIDRIIIQLAAPTLSMVHAPALRAADISRDAIAERISDAWMSPVVGRTYAVGPGCVSPTFDALCMAGVLAAGANARVLGATAAKLLGLWNRPVEEIHVGAPSRSGGVQGRFRFQRVRGLWLPAEGLEAGPIPIASAKDLMSSFALDHTPLQLAFVVGRAIYHRLSTVDSLVMHADARAHAPGNATLRAAIALVRGRSAGTRCHTEDQMHADLVELGIPPDLVNVRGALGLSRDEPDFAWHGRRVNVESDGGQHDDPAQAEDDRVRDAQAAALGWRILRVRSQDFWRRRSWVMERVRRFVLGEDVPMRPGTNVLEVPW